MAGIKKDSNIFWGESERRFRFLVDNLNGMVYRCANDNDWTMEYLSAYSKELTGYFPNQLIGNRAISYAELIHADDRDRVWDEIQQALNKQVPFQITYRIVAASGDEKYVWEQGRGVFDANGNVLALEGYITDITEFARLERELGERDKIYRLLADNSLDIIWLMDREFRFTYVSPSIQRVLGFTPDEYLGTRLPDHCSAEQFQSILDLIASELENGLTGRGVLLELELRHKDGRMIPLEVHARELLDDNHEIKGFQGNSRDITERVNQREELSRTRELLDKTFASLSDALLVVDTTTRTIVSCNPAVRDVFGYIEEEVVGRITEFLHVDRAHFEKFHEISFPMLEKYGAFRFEFHMRRKDGKIIDTENTITFMREDTGERKYVISLIRDITSRKSAEKQHAELREQLYQSQKLEAVGRLAGGIAHDFNNLLSIVLGYTEILLGNSELGDSNRDFLVDINDAATRAAKLTRQLLAFGRKQTLEMKVVDLNGLVVDFKKLLGRVIGEDIELTLNLCQEPLPIRADSTQLEQVLMNLAVNSRDAMPRGGAIRLSSELITLDQTSRSGELAAGKYARLEFCDTGVGMDEYTAGQIFEPFFSTKDRDKSSGLGLATSFGIIKQHCGDISVASQPGCGATFTILLPLDVAEISEKKSSGGGGAAAPVRRGSLLIVEDDVSVLSLIRKILEGHGHTVHAFSDTVEALNWVYNYREPIDILLSDVVMPGMKGPELYEYVREAHPETRVLFMSGYADDAFVELEKPLDDGQFIQKPFRMEELLRKLAALLG